MTEEQFDPINWCQELLATERTMTGACNVMLKYVRTGVIDKEIYAMDSYAQLRDWAGEMGLVHDELALTALRGLAEVPQEGRILLSIFRYLQLTTGKALTKEYFIEFFTDGMFIRTNMIDAWNKQCSDTSPALLDSVDWSTLSLRQN